MATVETAKVLKQGTLSKLSRNRHHKLVQRSKWQKRHFVLVASRGGTSLAYYHAGKCKGAVQLEGCAIASSASPSNSFVITGSDESGPCELHVAAASPDEMTSWMDAIRDASNFLKETPPVGEDREPTHPPPPVSEVAQPLPAVPAPPPPSAAALASAAPAPVAENRPAVDDGAATDPAINPAPVAEKQPAVDDGAATDIEDEEQRQRRSTTTCQDAFMKQLMAEARAEHAQSQTTKTPSFEQHDDDDDDDDDDEALLAELEGAEELGSRQEFLLRLGVAANESALPAPVAVAKS